MRHKAAYREAKYVDLLDAQCLDEGCRTRTHALDCGGHVSGAAGNACVIEQDHFPAPGQAIGNGRVPIVHSADEMLIEDEGYTAGLTKAAIGKADTVGFDELSGSGVMSVSSHGNSFRRLGAEQISAPEGIS
jgi:hypothetical protein